MNKTASRLTGLVVVVAVLLSVFITALPVKAAATISVSNNIFMQNVLPGKSYIHKMTVTSESSNALDMRVEAAGLGLSLAGGVLPLDSQDDASPYSARTFITGIDTPSFVLAPGAVQEVQVTISVPADAAPGEWYGDIHIYSDAGTGDGVSVVISANIPVIAIVPGGNLTKTGQITDLAVPVATTGNGVEIDTTFKNSGTARIQAKNQVTITDGTGNTVARVETPVSTPSIIPTFARLFTASVTPSGGTALAAGRYSVTSSIILDDGTLLDTRQTSFQITEAKATTAPPLTSNTAAREKSPAMGVSWSLAGGVMGGVLVIGVIVIVIFMRRTSPKSKTSGRRQ